jgi:A/G-specific adenine glycosylase
LVSEFMLQQTQVSRVLEKFEPFLAKFPTVAALARAPEKDVLAAWSGLGYYRRAKLLHRAAKAVVTDFGGTIPETVEQLHGLPGVGRYTAGAIASIVFGQPAPLVDGNVARVLMRLAGRPGTVAEQTEWVWQWAADLVATAKHPGSFNEGLMELGATVCTPSAPKCSNCPLRNECVAFAKGLHGEIPAPKTPTKRKPLYCASVLIEDGKGRVLVERRPATGMWASMYQAPTLESPEPISRERIEEWIGLAGLELVEEFDHGTTHRDVRFAVWRTCEGSGNVSPAYPSRRFAKRAEIAKLGLSNPQRKILATALTGP